VESRFLLDVVIGQSPAVLELLSSKDETLLIRGNSLLVLDFLLHVVNGVRGLDIKGNGLSGEGLYEDLHVDILLGWGGMGVGLVGCLRDWGVVGGWEWMGRGLGREGAKEKGLIDGLSLGEFGAIDQRPRPPRDGCGYKSSVRGVYGVDGGLGHDKRGLTITNLDEL